MAKNFILILGGARSGKSTFAQSLAAKLGGKVLFVATGEPLDAEMALRIEEHKRIRPKDWQTLEINTRVGQRLKSLIKDADVVLLDCITLLVSNIILNPSLSAIAKPSVCCHPEATPPCHSEATPLCHSEGAQRPKNLETLDPAEAEKQVMTEIEDLIDCINKHENNFIVVSNEVGLGLVPETKLGRIYRDLLGRANQLLAQHATQVYFMVSGIPVLLTDKFARR